MKPNWANIGKQEKLNKRNRIFLIMIGLLDRHFPYINHFFIMCKAIKIQAKWKMPNFYLLITWYISLLHNQLTSCVKQLNIDTLHIRKINPKSITGRIGIYFYFSFSCSYFDIWTDRTTRNSIPAAVFVYFEEEGFPISFISKFKISRGYNASWW